MNIVFLVIEIVVLSYFAYVTFYSFFFSIAGHFYKNPTLKGKGSKKKIAVFIPAYKEDGVIYDVAKNALEQSYGSENYEVIVIADSLKQATLDKLNTLNVRTEVVVFQKSTKVKALNEAMRRIGDNYDYAVILDADNLMKPDFLEYINDLHQQGYHAVQGHRAAKNKNNTMAFLDGLSEEINYHICSKGSTALNLSGGLKGSGMSFDYQLFKNLLGQMESIGGFDRELELRLIQAGVIVKYAHNVEIYDQKVDQQEIFQNQRTRWVSSQYFYLLKYFKKGIKSAFQGKISYFNSALLRNIQLPRLLNIGLYTFFVALVYLLNYYIPLHPLYWIIIYGIYIFSIFLAIPRQYYSYQFLMSIVMLPVIFWRMFLILFKLKGSNQKFIHTPHNSASTE